VRYHGYGTRSVLPFTPDDDRPNTVLSFRPNGADTIDGTPTRPGPNAPNAPNASSRRPVQQV
jgi:hypothetical protein